MENERLLLVLLVLLCTGSVNFVLLKCLYAEYGEEQAFFVSTGINVLYCICSAAARLPTPRLTIGRPSKF